MKMDRKKEKKNEEKRSGQKDTLLSNTKRNPINVKVPVHYTRKFEENKKQGSIVEAHFYSDLDIVFLTVIFYSFFFFTWGI